MIQRVVIPAAAPPAHPIQVRYQTALRPETTAISCQLSALSIHKPLTAHAEPFKSLSRNIAPTVRTANAATEG